MSVASHLMLIRRSGRRREAGSWKPEAGSWSLEAGNLTPVTGDCYHVRLAGLGEETFDVAVVGGGIIGCGIARDAALRGLRVALFERRDFGSGTTAASTR